MFHIKWSFLILPKNELVSGMCSFFLNSSSSNTENMFQVKEPDHCYGFGVGFFVFKPLHFSQEKKKKKIKSGMCGKALSFFLCSGLNDMMGPSIGG